MDWAGKKVGYMADSQSSRSIRSALISQRFLCYDKRVFLGIQLSHQISTRYVCNIQTYARKFEETFSGEPKKKKYNSLVRSLYPYKDINHNWKRQAKMSILGTNSVLQEPRAMLCAGFTAYRESKILQASPWGKETKLLQSCKSRAVYSTRSVLFTYLA